MGYLYYRPNNGLGALYIGGSLLPDFNPGGTEKACDPPCKRNSEYCENGKCKTLVPVKTTTGRMIFGRQPTPFGFNGLGAMVRWTDDNGMCTYYPVGLNCGGGYGPPQPSCQPPRPASCYRPLTPCGQNCKCGGEGSCGCKR